MEIGLGVAAGLLGACLGIFAWWSRRGGGPSARWWIGRDNGIRELTALVLLPAISGVLVSIGMMLAGTAEQFDGRWLSLLGAIMLFATTLATSAALGFSRSHAKVQPWVIPGWARVQGRTKTWHDRATQAPLKSPAPLRPMKVPPATRAWTELTQRLTATLQTMQTPKVGRVALTLYGRQGANVKIVLGKGKLTAEIPGTPFDAADLEVAATNARLRLDGWEPMDESTWQLAGSHRHPHALARTSLRALRMRDATIAPTMIGYTAERDTLFRRSPIELPMLGQPKARPMLRDSFQADAVDHPSQVIDGDSSKDQMPS